MRRPRAATAGAAVAGHPAAAWHAAATWHAALACAMSEAAFAVKGAFFGVAAAPLAQPQLVFGVDGKPFLGEPATKHNDWQELEGRAERMSRVCMCMAPAPARRCGRDSAAQQLAL